jgi:hypothetical protein
MKGGMVTANPMLAFGADPGGHTCEECSGFLAALSACLKRRGKRGDYRPHRSDWLACGHFKLSPMRA